MAKIEITRQRNMPGVLRRNVLPGQVFSLVRKDGTVSKKQYLHVANNGRFLSVNVATGELASTASGNKKVTIVGTAKFQFNRGASWGHRNVTRRQVKNNEMFQVKDITYAALGRLHDGKYIAVNVAHPQNGDYTAGRDADKNVTVVGTYSIAVKLAA